MVGRLLILLLLAGCGNTGGEAVSCTRDGDPICGDGETHAPQCGETEIICTGPGEGEIVDYQRPICEEQDRSWVAVCPTGWGSPHCVDLREEISSQCGGDASM